MNDSRLLLDDMSASDGQPGDRIWMLLSCMPSPSPIVQLVHEGKAYDAESISQKEKACFRVLNGLDLLGFTMNYSSEYG